MPTYRSHVLVCGGTGCVSNGSMKLQESLTAELARKGLDKEVLVVQTGCHGMCEAGPIVVVYPEGTFYTRVQPDDAREIVEEHLYKGRVVSRLRIFGRTTLEIQFITPRYLMAAPSRFQMPHPTRWRAHRVCRRGKVFSRDYGLIENYSAATRRTERTPSASSDTSDVTDPTLPTVARPSESRLSRRRSINAEPTTTASAPCAISRAFCAVFTPKPTATGSLVWRLIRATASDTRVAFGVAEPVMPVIDT